jgi:hypothetical protein
MLHVARRSHDHRGPLANEKVARAIHWHGQERECVWYLVAFNNRRRRILQDSAFNRDGEPIKRHRRRKRHFDLSRTMDRQVCAKSALMHRSKSRHPSRGDSAGQPVLSESCRPCTLSRKSKRPIALQAIHAQVPRPVRPSSQQVDPVRPVHPRLSRHSLDPTRA